MLWNLWIFARSIVQKVRDNNTISLNNAPDGTRTSHISQNSDMVSVASFKWCQSMFLSPDNVPQTPSAMSKSSAVIAFFNLWEVRIVLLRSCFIMWLRKVFSVGCQTIVKGNLAVIGRPTPLSCCCRYVSTQEKKTKHERGAYCCHSWPTKALCRAILRRICVHSSRGRGRWS